MSPKNKWSQAYLTEHIAAGVRLSLTLPAPWAFAIAPGLLVISGVSMFGPSVCGCWLSPCDARTRAALGLQKIRVSSAPHAPEGVFTCLPSTKCPPFVAICECLIFSYLTDAFVQGDSTIGLRFMA